MLYMLLIKTDGGSLKKYSFTKEDKQFAQKFIFKIREYLDFCKSGMNRKVGCTFVNCLYN